MDITVETTTGLNSAEEPAAVWFGQRRVAVRSIVDRWYGSKARWWKVDTEDGLYVLRRDEPGGTWELAAVTRT
ncbi:hypothetical protein PE066_04465 [Ramlibacter tataouinensis]|uniref:hypothetical protein n=1 Tax=Ramlibacter tataouinensis TaxID=94132 RepID=UPI0022F39079|nr:hypothetical protein [Ramlibacter tataouinensis]WBY02799.1 hypothetical protein PE066_04465 [Ramlibacter tataouinensis]